MQTQRKPYIPDLSPQDLLVIDYLNTVIAVKKVSKRELARTLNVGNFQVYNPLLRRTPLTQEFKTQLFKVLGITNTDIINLLEKAQDANKQGGILNESIFRF